MAGGKQTPRQKMINLMYLVFIAMLAMNVSVEVITAFGLMNEKFEASNVRAGESNQFLFEELGSKAEDDPTRYKSPYDKATQINKLTSDFYTFLESLKADAVKGFEIDPETGKLPYEQMTKSQIDYDWFVGEGYSERGNEIVNRFEKFKSDFKAVLEDDTKYQFLVQNLENAFNTADVETKDGVKKPYLHYHFQGFPAVASLAYLSSMQNSVREIEHEAYNLFLGHSLKQAASMRNYQAMVITDKSVYFTGEPIKGRVVLGRYDKQTVPTEVVVNGNRINLANANAFSDGQVQLNTSAGSVGEHKFTGHFTFMEDGQPVKVDILNSNYVVVPRPNTATIAADKMNVVYMGLDNPISASFAGISSDKVNVTASSGSLRKTGDGKYILRPVAGAGQTVTITATGTMADGKTVADKQVFRIKPLPKPFGTVRGEYSPRGPVSNLKQVTIGAKFEDFEFDANLIVTGYTVIFPNGSEVVTGTRLPESTHRLIDRLKPGDVVRFTRIKVRVSGVDIVVKDAADATFTIQ